MTGRIPLETLDEGRRAMADALQHVLGNTCQLISTTTSFRWNVVGPHHLMLRDLFAAQGEEMTEALDPVAERIRALGFPAVPFYVDEIIVPMADLARDTPVAEQMVSILAQGHSAMHSALGAAGDVARGEGDEASAFVLAGRQLAHDRHRWTLEAFSA